MTQWRMSDLDVVFISYDEVCAEDNYRQLCEMSPRPPKRVHGVKGFHNAYLQASRLADTPRFIAVDGDNLVNASVLFSQTVDDRGLRDIVFSFNSRNAVNGLIYGNGGIKCWPKELLEHVATHEESDQGLNAVDFNHVCRYLGLGILASETLCAASPFHAFRAGWREGVKLSIAKDVQDDRWSSHHVRIPPLRQKMLKIWLSVGADAMNGLWTILGARVGLIDYWQGRLPLGKIADYEFFASVWDKYAGLSDVLVLQALAELGGALEAMNLRCPVLVPEASEWFKSVFVQPTYAGAFDATKPSPLR